VCVCENTLLQGGIILPLKMNSSSFSLLLFHYLVIVTRGQWDKDSMGLGQWVKVKSMGQGQWNEGSMERGQVNGTRSMD